MLHESHFKATKMILKYLKGTTNVGLWYPNESNIVLSGFPDFDYVGCKLDRKRQVVHVIYLDQA